MDEAIAKKKNRMKETKEGNLRHMREGKGEGEVWGSKCCTRRTVFVFRIWEDEFPWNLGCSIRNCLFFCGLEEPAMRNIQLGMEGRIEIVKKLHGGFLLKFLFHRIAKRDFLILLELIFVRFKSRHQVFH